MVYNANENELSVLKHWEDTNAFEKSVEQRPEDKPYVFYDGPPFATGLPHYGHILSSVAKDVVPRYWTMKGYRVRRRWGWDCHGLPIENLIEKKLEISGKKDIEESIGVGKFNDECRSAVLQYAADWKTMVSRMGRWVEFDNAYKTMDTTYMESIWWALKTIWDKGLIYEGRKVLMYCPRCETPVSKAEIAMDHSYKDVTEESVVVKFRLTSPFQINGLDESLPVYVLAWTTTPWTLPGNLALAVGKDIEYTLVKFDGAYYVAAKERLMHLFDAETQEFEVVAQLTGSDLLDLDYEPLFGMPAMREDGKRAYYVMPGDFVTTEEGTGIVHTAVMYGEDDYNLGLEFDLPVVPMLDDKGHYNDVVPAFIQGAYYKKGEKAIKQDLEKRDLLFSREQTTHAYPHCWRCETALIYNAISAWFINIQDVQKRMLKLNEKVDWFPKHLKHGRFQNILETAPDWNISRNRYWATALPFWKSEDGDVLCVGSIDELEKLSGMRVDDLHKHTVDEVVITKDGKEYRRVPEVIDCWFEAGSMPYAEFHYPFENKELFEARFPGQYISEYIAQTRAWFYYMHVVAALLFDSHSFDNVLCTGTILNDKGEKLSKSKRNFTDPWIIIEQYGMDALRYYLMTSVVMQAENLFFNDREVRDVYNKVLNTVWNVVTFFEMYAEQDSAAESQPSDHVLDKWIMSKTNALVADMTVHMDNYDLVKAGRALKPFIEDLSQWYVRRSRDRFKSEDVTDRNAAVATLRQVLLTLSKVMAPFMPFLAESVYQKVAVEQKESVHLEDWPAVSSAFSVQGSAVLEEMDKARKIVEMGLSLRKEVGVRVRQPLQALRVQGVTFSEELLSIVADEMNVKHVSFGVGEDGWATKEDSGMTVALDTTMTDELKKEGLLREVVRAINGMRKEQKLTPQDMVELHYHTDDDMLNAVFTDFAEEIQRLTKVTSFHDGGTQHVDIDGIPLTLSLV